MGFTSTHINNNTTHINNNTTHINKMKPKDKGIQTNVRFYK